MEDFNAHGAITRMLGMFRIVWAALLVLSLYCITLTAAVMWLLQ